MENLYISASPGHQRDTNYSAYPDYLLGDVMLRLNSYPLAARSLPIGFPFLYLERALYCKINDNAVPTMRVSVQD